VRVFCPSCGAALEFRYDDSFVRVCSACRSAIVRGDRGLETFGQFADLAPSVSGLSLEQRGRFQGVPFVLSGRVQYAHPAGGSWEEFYLKLADGRWAWLAHAHGEWTLTFRSAQARGLPDFARLAPGMVVELGADAPGKLSVGECNVATPIGAEGEIPFQFTPGTQSRFVDLSGTHGRFATIDYGEAVADEAPMLYVGRRVTLVELGLTENAASEQRFNELGAAHKPEQDAGAQRLACPHCGGSIELRVPGLSLCVACPYCGSLLDCEGPLAVLALGQPDAELARIPLGASAEFQGVRFVVTGRLRRVATYSDGFLSWDEYLLYAPDAGYRWLVHARGHYNFVTPLPAAAVNEGHDAASYGDTRFQLYDRAQARVSGVWGEFYWKVSVGETVETRDYIAPPAMLSREASEHEVHWSLGLYQSPADIQTAFQLERLPDDRQGVAGNQPFPHRHLVWVTAALALGLLVCTLLRLALADARPVYAAQLPFDASALVTSATPGEAAPAAASYVFFTPSFELQSRRNIRVDLALPLSNSWVFANVDLIEEATGQIRNFGEELSFYSGVEGGEAWSEGSSSVGHVLAAGAAGSHVLRLELQTPLRPSGPLRLSVKQNVFPWSQLGWALLVLGLPAAALGLYQWNFERMRWSDSDYAPRVYELRQEAEDSSA
jgi:uncharacterized protein DUF4178